MLIATKRKYKFYRALYLVCLFFIWTFYSCSTEDSVQNVKSVLLVYMGGDNDLSNESNDKLNAMKTGWINNPEIKLLIFQDDAYSSPRLLEPDGEGGEKVIEEYAEINSADASTLSKVVKTVQNYYPKAQMSLLVFSHASGWLPQNSLVYPTTKATSRSIILDKNQRMELADFASALPNHQFQNIIFEACFMGGIEVAYQLRNKAHYLAVSSAEILSPGFTKIYAKKIHVLAAGDLSTFMNETFQFFELQQDEQMRSATFSIICTDKLNDLATFIQNNCELPEIGNTTNLQVFDRNKHHLFFDFEDYFLSLTSGETKKNELIQKINEIVIWKASTKTFIPKEGGFEIKKHSGLTTYVAQSEYSFLNEQYKQLDWYKTIKAK